MKADEQREVVAEVRNVYLISERRACRLIAVSRSVCRYTKKREADVFLVNTLLEAANAPRWGCRKLYDWLRNRGHVWSHKRIHRVCWAMQNVREI